MKFGGSVIHPLNTRGMGIFLSLQTDNYQVLGRTVHMDFVREYLSVRESVNFDDTQDLSNNIDLTILADTIYVRVRIQPRGYICDGDVGMRRNCPKKSY